MDVTCYLFGLDKCVCFGQWNHMETVQKNPFLAGQAKNDSSKIMGKSWVETVIFHQRSSALDALEPRLPGCPLSRRRPQVSAHRQEARA